MKSENLSFTGARSEKTLPLLYNEHLKLSEEGSSECSQTIAMRKKSVYTYKKSNELKKTKKGIWGSLCPCCFPTENEEN